MINKKNIERENKTGIPYTYTVGEEVHLRKGTEHKYGTPYEGPFKILKIYNNRTVKILMGTVTVIVNTRRLIPFKRKKEINLGGECSEVHQKKRTKI